MSKERGKEVFSIFCRNVGPGGTTVAFYATPDGLATVWSNEQGDEDGDLVRWEEVASLALLAQPKSPPGGPAQKRNPQPKKRRR